MQVLSKYSKTKNVTNIDDITQKQYLESLNTLQGEKAPDDYYNPFNYEEWYLRNTGIIVGSAQKQYTEYLKTWYTDRYTQTTVATDLKNDYINFLKSLTLFLKQDDPTNILNDINWDDPLEVEQIIPYCSKKLKEIAIYFVNKREAIKNTKLKYNINGANQALERLFYEYLLKAFTKRDYVLNITDADLYSTFPELSSVNSDFQVYVEELYDDTNYMDKNPEKSASYYFDTTNPVVTAFYNEKGFGLEDYDWLFKTGFASLCADNPLFVIMSDLINQNLPASSYIDIESNILNQYYQFKLASKYIGTDQFYVSGGYYVPWTATIDYNLVQGNNWFYFPSGEFFNEFNDMTIDALPLISSSLVDSGATGYKNYLNADKLFIRCDNSVSGAWLKKTIINTVVETMSAYLIDSKPNTFRFPYPGYGLSGEDLSWSGKQLSNFDKSFEYLTDDVKEEIKRLYWTDYVNTSSISSISIHDSKLIEGGATAGSYYDEADHVSIRVTPNPDMVHDSVPDEIYQGDMQHAWLHKVQKTDLPIARGQNYLHWPLFRYEKNTTSLQNLLTSECAPMALSSLDSSSFIGARAGYDLYDSDIIYKLDSRNGMPIECAFLSGAPITNIGGLSTVTPNATGVIQNALALKCTPNNYITFIWQDDDTYLDDVTLKHVSHQPDCPYLFAEQHSLYLENPADAKELDYRLWQKCECGAIKYSPFGHTGQKYDDYKGYADIIFEDYFASEGVANIAFNKTVWHDSVGINYLNSDSFAWYQVTGASVEPDIGWGEGRWVAGGIPSNTRRFKFKKGRQYRYLRTGIGHGDTYLTDGTMPYVIIKHQYQNTPNPIWVKAIADGSGNWVQQGDTTDMVLNAGDYLVYDHIDSNWYCITGVGNTGSSYAYYTSSTNLTSNRWVNFDRVTTGVNVNISWPSILYSNGPSAMAFQLQNVQWKITAPDNVIYNYDTTPEQILTIQPNIAGTWVVTVTGIELDKSTKHYYNGVANFDVLVPTRTDTISGEHSIDTIYADTINMSINTPISGWNYNTKSYDGTSLGARPFWAYASDSNDKITKYKGIDKWGGGIRVVDDYTLITQPESANLTFDLNTYVEYTAQSQITWIEPITFNVNISSANWCDLVIDTTKVSPLSDYLYNLNKEMIVTGTNNISNLVLAPKINDVPIFVNYWATNAFTWSQVFTNTSLGLPPTGGVYIPIITGLLVEAVAPYANLTNRHYPTIATVPHVEELYSTSDTGGYFTPSLLGASTFLSKRNTNKLDTTFMLTSTNRGMSAIYQDINTYITDQGLSNTTCITPVSNLNTDSSWMKASITEWKHSGMIKDPSYYQQFMPYQSKYENNKYASIGIHQQNDEYDPWNGVLDNNWENSTDYPPSFNKQYPIDNWYSQFDNTNNQLWQWKVDIFGNQYALLKPITNTMTIYDKKQATGDMFIRDNRNIVSPISSITEDFYNTLTTVYNISSEFYTIKDFDVWYDTFMIRTPNFVVLSKLDYDFDTGITNFGVNVSHVLQLSGDGYNNKFGGVWFNNIEKSVTLSTLVSAGSSIYPQLKSYNIEKNNIIDLYNTTCADTDMLSGLELTEIEEPLLTYNVDTKTYVMSFIAKSNKYTSFVLLNIYLQNKNGVFTVSKVSAVTPTS
jgi:hypothetical protein